MQRQRTKKTVSNTMPNLKINGGLFQYIPQYGDITPFQLGLIYSTKRSGDKQISPLTEEYLTASGVLDSYGDECLGLLMTNLFKDKWDKIWEALTAEYNPLENTDRHATIIDTLSGQDDFTKGQQSNTKGEQSNTKGQQSNTKGEQQNTEGSQTNTTGQQTITKGQEIDTIGQRHTVDEDKTSAFNNSSYSPDKKSEQTVDQTTDTLGERIDTNGQREDTKGQRIDTEGQRIDIEGQRIDIEGQRVDIDGTRKDTTEYGKKNTHTEEIHGNIGTMKTQELLDAEIQIRQYNFFEQIFKDVDSYLTIRIY